MSEPNILYHYCSVETFFNIIKNRTLWLSDIEKSNDSQELIALKEGVHSAILKKYSEYLSDVMKKTKEIETDPKEALEFMKSKEEHQNIFNRVIETFKVKEDLFMHTWGICFSEEGDLLSQWRGYADDGRGITIGFSKEYFGLSLLSISEDPIVFAKLGKVHYSKEHIEKIIKEKTELDSININTSAKDVSDILYKMLSTTSKESPFYKESSFSEEKEWRLAITDMFPRNYDKESYLDLLKNANSKLFPLEVKDWNYVIKQGTLVSYVELYLNNINEAISSIIIGPKSKCSIEDIRNFLIYHGLLKNRYDSSIKIVKSRSSYR